MRWLARREHSRAELIHKLRVKGCDEATARSAVDAVSTGGLQSDERCVESVVRGRVARGQGPQRIRQALRDKGLSPDMADTLAGYDWEALIREVYRRKYGQSEPATPKERASRMRFLAQRGFSGEQISALFRRQPWATEFEDLDID